MFTGIIQAVSQVHHVDTRPGSVFVFIDLPPSWKLSPGASVSVNGVCSTVRSRTGGLFEVEYMPETIKKTTVGDFVQGTVVNLERSMRLGDLVDGHLVQSHVDTQGIIKEIKPVKQSVVMKISIPPKFMRLVAVKGSITVDGISLTVVAVGKDWFTVSLVSFTIEHTNLGQAVVGQKVNIETDVLAKYLDRLINGNT